MDEWRDLVFEALDRLGARKRLLPGSLVMQEFIKATPNEGTELRAYLRDTKTSFSKFLRQFPELHVELRGAADMLVGFEGAEEGPVPEALPVFRADVYDAFSMRVDPPYVYDKALKRFKQERAEGDDVIAVPSISQEFLIGQRRAFAAEQAPRAADQLLASLTADRPLNAFRDCLTKLHLQQQWKRFRLLSIDERLRKWAQDSNIPFSREWYNDKTVMTVPSVRDVIEMILAEMSDEDIRSLTVPIRIVERLMNKQSTSER